MTGQIGRVHPPAERRERRPTPAVPLNAVQRHEWRIGRVSELMHV